jgi:Flp pilus assembly protein TadB
LRDLAALRHAEDFIGANEFCCELTIFQLSSVWAGILPGRGTLENGVRVMVFDILVALVITAIAVVLGITVHPVLLFIIVLAVIYLVVRSRGRSRA